MDLTKTRNGSELTIAISGRLDTATAAKLEAELSAEGLAGVETLILDLSGLDYVSSYGLRLLLKAQLQMERQGRMKLVHVSDMLQDIFSVTGFSEFLTIGQHPDAPN